MYYQGTGKTSLARAVLMSASDWLVSEERTREMYAKKMAQEEPTAFDDNSSSVGQGPPSSNAAEAGSLPSRPAGANRQSVAVLLERLASSRRFSATGLGG